MDYELKELTKEQQELFEEMKDEIMWHGHTINNEENMNKSIKTFLKSLGYKM